jgi:hypothetical protein
LQRIFAAKSHFAGSGHARSKLDRSGERLRLFIPLTGPFVERALGMKEPRAIRLARRIIGPQNKRLLPSRLADRFHLNSELRLHLAGIADRLLKVGVIGKDFFQRKQK